MGLVHQAPRTCEIPGLEKLREGLGASALGDHVPGPRVGHGIHERAPALQEGLVDITQRRDPGLELPQCLDRRLARGATSVVRGVGERAGSPRVHHHNGSRLGERHGAGLERAAVEEQGAVLLAEGRGELVHQAAVDADEAALGTLGVPSHLDGRPVEARRGRHGPGDGQLERRR